MADSSDGALAGRSRTQVADTLEDNAEVMTNTQLEEPARGQPAAVQAEIVRINTEARPIALQIALIVPLVAGLLGLINGFRMTRLLDIKPSEAAEAMLVG